ncbi:MAG: hypothetical protein M3483_07800 [Gemmatimonadota bacterium]|nr:hypothetical protein [Gemmatimonadota bacterium]
MTDDVLRRADRVHRALRILTATVLAAALTFDLLGIALEREGMWTAGHSLLTAGIALALFAVGLRGLLASQRYAPGWRRTVLLPLLPISLLALARWVRGAPEVAPDPPVLLAEALGVILLAISWQWGRARR